MAPLTEAVLVLVLSLAAATVLLSLSYTASAVFLDAAQSAREYALLRSVYPFIVPVNKTHVHVCLNTTAAVFTTDGRAAEPRCVSRHGARTCAARTEGEHYCRRYLGVYKVGDRIAYFARGDKITVFHNYTLRSIQR